jgi:outer membrane protein assembly factor BamE (lipoprotein component of BamABCDE complex)
MARAWMRWWFGVSGFMFGLVAAAVLAAGAAFMYWQGRSEVQAQAASAPTVYLRDDFTASVLGKSEDQVLEAVGKPDLTSEDAQATYWHYRSRTRNPTTGRIDSDVQVVFERGHVTALNY